MKRIGRGVRDLVLVTCLTLSMGPSGFAADPRIVERLNTQTTNLLFEGNLPAAEAAAKKAVAAATKLPQTEEAFQLAQINLASILVARGKADEGRRVLADFIGVAFRVGASNNIKLQALTNYLHIRKSEAIDPARLPYLDRYIATASEVFGAESTNLIGPLIERSLAEYNVGRGAQCADDIVKVLALREQLPDRSPADDLSLRSNLAMCQLRAAQYDQAINGFRELHVAMAQMYGISDERTFKSESDLGFALEQGGRISEAASVAERVLQGRISYFGEDYTGTLISMINAASVYQQRNMLSEAENYYLRVIAKYDEGRALDEWKITALQGLVGLYVTVGRVDEAQKLLELADRDLARLANPDVSLLVRGRQHWASIYEAQNDSDRAISVLTQLVEGEQDSSTEPSVTSGILRSLASLATLKGDNDHAKRYILNALDVEKSASIENVETKLQYSRILLVDGDIKEAERTLVSAQALATTRLGQDSPQAAAVSNTLAAVRLAVGDRETAIRSLSTLIDNPSLYMQSVSQRGPSSAQAVEAGNIALALVFKEPAADVENLAAKFVINYKARVGDTEARTRKILALERADASSKDIIDNYDKARSDFTALSKRVVAGDISILTRLRQVEAEMRASKDIVDQLASDGGQSAYDTIVTPAEVSARLGGHTSLVEYFVYYPDASDVLKKDSGEPRYGAMILQATRTNPEFVDIASLKEIGDLVSSLSSTFADTNAGIDVTAKLYQLLVAKIVPGIRDGNRLLISTAGVLGAVPFDMLLDANGHRLIDSGIDYRFIVSGRFLNADRSQPKGVGLVAFGGADFDAVIGPPLPREKIAEHASDFVAVRSAATLTSFQPLASTATEVGMIAQTWREKSGEEARVYLGEHATEENLRDVKSPRVLHLATHGITMPLKRTDTLLPSLQVAIAFAGANRALETDAPADGIAFGYELEELDLSQTDLVVLSACETGIGLANNYEGIIAVEQAFRRAGARAVLSTLHPISDAYTTLFMRDFYNTWLGMDDPDANEALRRVKLSWLHSENADQRDPKVWAPFVLVSKGDEVISFRQK